MKILAILIAVMLTANLSSCHDADLLQSEPKPDADNSISSQAPPVSQTPELSSESQNLKPPVVQCESNTIKLS
ncbi:MULTISPECIES: hypothetical protein [unclassified Psychrobacter]|uniref:hypothetical protein n=1 Tax=unclassified Psychrobacter TaxID=196806 RepID=UPI0040382BBC